MGTDKNGARMESASKLSKNYTISFGHWINFHLLLATFPKILINFSSTLLDMRPSRMAVYGDPGAYLSA